MTPRLLPLAAIISRSYLLILLPPESLLLRSSAFQGIGNTLPPLISSMTRLVLFALPASLLSLHPGFQIRHVWYLSVGSIIFQACLNLLLLRRELQRKLVFPQNFPEGIAEPGGAVAS